MPRRSKWTEVEWTSMAAKAVTMRAAGVRVQEIAQRLGCSETNARNLLDGFRPKYFKEVPSNDD